MDNEQAAGKRSAKRKLILFGILGAVAVSIGVMVAYFTDTTSITNTIKTGKVSHTIVETVNDLEKTGVSVQITGTSDCYVRAHVQFPKVRSRKTGEWIEPVISGTAPNWSVPDSDGYMYYNQIVGVDKGVVSLPLYDSIKYSTDDSFEKMSEEELKKLNIIIYVESVQSDNLPQEVTDAQSAFNYIGGK